MEAYEGLKKWIAWLQFDGGLRTEIYRELALLLSNQVQLNEALQILISIYSEGREATQHPAALALKSALRAMEEGHCFSESLRPWIPAEEANMLASGEAAGQLLGAFDSANALICSKRRMTSAIYGALAYPSFLLLLICGLLYMVSQDLVPRFEVVVPREKWTGAAAILATISDFVTNYGLLTFVGIIALILGIFLTLPLSGGVVRTYLDRVPPWSLYRMIQGSSFLLNISALVSAGEQLDVALKHMAAQSKPWLRVRLEAARAELAKGKNFGRALIDTGYGFPDPKVNYFLAAVSEYGGSETAMASIGERWVEDSIRNIENISSLLSTLGLAFAGGVMILVVVGAGSFQELVQQASGAQG